MNQTDHRQHSFLSLLLQYIHHHRKSFLLAALFLSIFAFVFFLSGIPLNAIGYGFLLCLFLGSIVFCADFVSYAGRHQLLLRQQKQIGLGTGHLPNPSNLIEEDYQLLLRTLWQEKSGLISENDRLQKDHLDYFTMWAHQIKTPIAASRLILQSEDLPAYRELSGELFKIEQYVSMALSYLRLNSDTTDYVIGRCNLNDIVKQALRRYAGFFIRQKIRLDFQETDCFVLTDEKWLLFVIEQLLSNALKYTPSGTITIQILPDSQSLIIQDTGIGIREEDLPRIFDKGYTGYNGRTYQKATGLGLYLCRRILTGLSHTIAIQSSPGKGTAVTIGLDTCRLVPGQEEGNLSNL